MKPLPVIRPCHEAWASMRPLQRGARHCGTCDRVVHDVATLTAAELRALVTLHGARGLCARQTIAPTGELVLAPTPARATRPVALGSVWLALQASACASAPPPPADAVVLAPAPPPDGDADAVPDDLDRCPTEPGSIEHEGCPEPTLVRVGGIAGEQLLDRLFFAPRSDRIRKVDRPILDAIAQSLARNAYLLRVGVIGHVAPGEVPAARARDLGLRRARAVVDALVERGVAPERLTALTWGADHPLQAGRSRDEQAQNRRVELAVEEDGLCDGLPVQ